MQRKYVWIVTKQTADGASARVVFRADSMEEARKRSEFKGGNFEGPVPSDMYPLGKIIELETE